MRALRHGPLHRITRQQQPQRQAHPGFQPAAGTVAQLNITAMLGGDTLDDRQPLPRLGCVNIHASLLPRWRAARGVQRAIEAGDSETGNTIMQMDAGLDTGAINLPA